MRKGSRPSCKQEDECMDFCLGWVRNQLEAYGLALKEDQVKVMLL